MGYYSTITDVELEAKLECAENPVLEEEWNTFLFNARNDNSNFLLNVLEAEAAFSDDGELEEILFGTAGREGKLYQGTSSLPPHIVLHDKIDSKGVFDQVIERSSATQDVSRNPMLMYTVKCL